MISIRNGWGSHVPMLLAAFEATDGPVLELGAGDCSTPLLHSLCHVTKRSLLTVESNPVWFSRFDALRDEVHDVSLISQWDGFYSNVIDGRDWGLIFVDQSPSDSRAAALARVKGKTVVVVHDAERKDGGLRDVINGFKYRLFDKPRARQPWTAAMSHEPLSFSAPRGFS